MPVVSAEGDEGVCCGENFDTEVAVNKVSATGISSTGVDLPPNIPRQRKWCVGAVCVNRTVGSQLVSTIP